MYTNEAVQIDSLTFAMYSNVVTDFKSLLGISSFTTKLINYALDLGSDGLISLLMIQIKQRFLLRSTLYSRKLTRCRSL